MGGYSEWIPKECKDDLAARLDNAFLRVSGSVGYDIAFDQGRARTFKETAGEVLDSGLTAAGPAFLRMGQGLLSAGGFKPGPGLSLKDIAGEILSEFYAEGNAGWQSVRAALYADALGHMKNLDSEHAQTILRQADLAFITPDREEFTRAALPYCGWSFTPFSLAFLSGAAVFMSLILVIRVPHVAVAGGLAAGGLAFYLARNRRRRAALNLLNRLPRDLYDILRRGLNSNIRRYAEVVNAGLRAL